MLELLVALTIIATLLTLAAPRYIGSVDKARDAVLKENLTSLRDAIDKYYGDHGVYPSALEDLVANRYLRRVPEDPMTGSNTTWVVVPSPDAQKSGVFDIKSGATGKNRDGLDYQAM